MRNSRFELRHFEWRKIHLPNLENIPEKVGTAVHSAVPTETRRVSQQYKETQRAEPSFLNFYSEFIFRIIALRITRNSPFELTHFELWEIHFSN